MLRVLLRKKRRETDNKCFFCTCLKSQLSREADHEANKVYSL